MIICKEVETKHKFGDKPWLGFECVTMVPMCQKLIDVKLLTEREKTWVNEYHRLVWEKVGSLFDDSTPDGARTRKWLQRECAEI